MKHLRNLVGACLSAALLSACATHASPGVVPAPNNPSVTNARKVFHYTGRKQFFTVPTGVTEITITADGASGAGTSYYAGGFGGLLQATVPVTPYEVLDVFVGGSGSNGGFQGGGKGSGSAGGGSSDVRLYGTGDRIIDAGGGGGAGASEGSSFGSGGSAILLPSGRQYASGGNGGGSTGANGINGETGSYGPLGGYGGYGGTQTAGGNGGGGGSSSCSGGTGASGARHKGGSGGAGCFYRVSAGGGGGGGYYGGGGGGGGGYVCGRTQSSVYGYCNWGGGGGGGGGSSFIEQAATTIKNIQGGAPVGNGQIVISW